MWSKMGISSISALKSNACRIAIRISLISVFCLTSSGFTSGIESRFGVELADNIALENNLYDTDHPEEGFGYDSWGNEFILSPSVSLSFGDRLTAFLLADFSWTHYGDGHDDETDADLGLAIVCMAFPQALFSAGLQPVTAGRGLINDENEPGLSIDLTLSDRLALNVSGSVLDDSSALYSVNMGYSPGLFEKIDVFAAYYQGGDDAFSRYFYLYEEQNLLATPIIIQFPSNTGYLAYLGAGADLFVLDNYLQFTVIFERGELEFVSEEYTVLNETRTLRRTLDVSSFLADVEVSRNLSAIWSLSGFIRVQSGGDGTGHDQYDGYVTPIPLTYRTLVFSHERFFSDTDQDGLISNTVTHAGVVAPGMGLSYTPLDNLLIKGLVSAFYPFQSLDGASFYGWECDLKLSWDVTPRINYHVQAGLFQYGDVVENLQGEGPPPASCIVTGITVSF